MASPPSGSKPRRRPVLIAALTALLVLLVFAVILFLSLPYLVSPDAKIPPADPVLQQIQIQNIVTKTKASLANTLMAGDGRLYLHFSAQELNALLLQSLSLKLRGEITPLGSITGVSAKGVATDLALSWKGRLFGLDLVTMPSPSRDGKLVLNVQEIRLGKIPLPRGYVGDYAASRLPPGVRLSGKPLSLTVNPQEFIGPNLPPVIKDPKLYVENIYLSDNSLTVVARLAFRLGL